MVNGHRDVESHWLSRLLFICQEGCWGNTRREKEAGGNTVNQRRENGGDGGGKQGKVRTERKRAKSLFKMLKSEMSHTPCPPFVPLGPPLVQHASDGSVRRLGKTRRVCPCFPPTNCRGSYKVFILRWTDGRTVQEQVTSAGGAEKTRKKKTRKQTRQKKDTHIVHHGWRREERRADES